jgi:hypothetical protein
MTCKTCAHLGVAPDKAGRIVVRAANAYACKAPEPDRPPLPHSITTSYNFRWPLSRCYVRGEDGEGCPTYVERAKSRAKEQA